MPKKKDENDNLFCSFCGKNQSEVRKLIAGPAVYICDECIQLCSEIIEEESEKDSTDTEQVMVPKEIKGHEAQQHDQSKCDLQHASHSVFLLSAQFFILETREGKRRFHSPSHAHQER